MYRGSSGGEIALLLDRLFSRLEIPLNKVQFILTTASMPTEDEKYIERFFNSLTGKEYSKCVALFGSKDIVKKKYKILIFLKIFLLQMLKNGYMIIYLTMKLSLNFKNCVEMEQNLIPF